MTKSNPVIGYSEGKSRHSHKGHGHPISGEQAGLTNDAWEVWKQQYMPAIRAMRKLGMKEKKMTYGC